MVIFCSPRDHVMDSLPYIRSTASVQVMRDQIVRNAVPKDTIAEWMASLALLIRYGIFNPRNNYCVFYVDIFLHFRQQ